MTAAGTLGAGRRAGSSMAGTDCEKMIRSIGISRAPYTGSVLSAESHTRIVTAALMEASSSD
jgi:hypothetical protein